LWKRGGERLVCPKIKTIGVRRGRGAMPWAWKLAYVVTEDFG